ncbi:hypothetical protein LINPERPRIM_LOCUS16024 [Linum perenne]
MPEALSSTAALPVPSKLRPVGPAGSGPEPAVHLTIRVRVLARPATAGRVSLSVTASEPLLRPLSLSSLSEAEAEWTSTMSALSTDTMSPWSWKGAAGRVLAGRRVVLQI